VCACDCGKKEMTLSVPSDSELRMSEMLLCSTYLSTLLTGIWVLAIKWWLQQKDNMGINTMFVQMTLHKNFSKNVQKKKIQKQKMNKMNNKASQYRDWFFLNIYFEKWFCTVITLQFVVYLKARNEMDKELNDE